MNFDDNFLTCKFKTCSNRLDIPVTLPCCGNTICKKHIEEFYVDKDKQKIKCLLCNNIYQLPSDGLKINVIISELLNQFFGKYYHAASKVCNKFNENVHSFQQNLTNPSYLIYEYFQILKSTIDLDREQLKESIDNHYDLLIQLANRLEIRMNSDLKFDFKEYNDNLNDFKAKYKNYHTVLNKNVPLSKADLSKIEQEIEEINSNLLMQMDHFRDELLKDKQFQYYPNDVNTECLGKLVEIENKYDIISSLEADSIKIWDLDTGKCLKTIRQNPFITRTRPIPLAWGLVLSGEYESLSLWDLTTNNCTDKYDYEKSCPKVLLRIDDDQFLSGSDDGVISLWNLGDHQPIMKFNSGKCPSLLAKYSDDKFISCSGDNEIKIWNLDESDCLNTLKCHKDKINDLKLLKNDKVITCSDDCYIKIWDLSKLECIQTIYEVTRVKFIEVLSDHKILYVTE